METSEVKNSERLLRFAITAKKSGFSVCIGSTQFHIFRDEPTEQKNSWQTTRLLHFYNSSRTENCVFSATTIEALENWLEGIEYGKRLMLTEISSQELSSENRRQHTRFIFTGNREVNGDFLFCIGEVLFEVKDLINISSHGACFTIKPDDKLYYEICDSNTKCFLTYKGFHGGEAFTLSIEGICVRHRGVTQNGLDAARHEIVMEFNTKSSTTSESILALIKTMNCYLKPKS